MFFYLSYSQIMQLKAIVSYQQEGKGEKNVILIVTYVL